MNKTLKKSLVKFGILTLCLVCLGAVKNVSIAQIGEIETKKETPKQEKKIDKEEKEVKDDTKYISRGVPRDAKNGASFKSFMSYKMITNRNSKQWELQQQCITDNNGLRRYNYNDDSLYCVAMGSFYSTKIGTMFRVTIKDSDEEKVIKVILADCKDDRDTDEETHSHISKNGNVIEFLVNQRELNSLSKRMGDVSYCGDPNLKGEIVKIEEIKD